MLITNLSLSDDWYFHATIRPILRSDYELLSEGSNELVFPGTIISIGLSAILFGLMHGATDPIYFISKALLGLILAIVYYRTIILRVISFTHVE